MRKPVFKQKSCEKITKQSMQRAWHKIGRWNFTSAIYRQTCISVPLIKRLNRLIKTRCDASGFVLPYCLTYLIFCLIIHSGNFAVYSTKKGATHMTRTTKGTRLSLVHSRKSVDLLNPADADGYLARQRYALVESGYKHAIGTSFNYEVRRIWAKRLQKAQADLLAVLESYEDPSLSIFSTFRSQRVLTVSITVSAKTSESDFEHLASEFQRIFKGARIMSEPIISELAPDLKRVH